MFYQGNAANHNVVKVSDDEFAFHWLQDAIHHAHELAGCTSQATRLDSPLVQTKFSSGGCLLPVSCCNANLIVTRHQVQCSEPTGAVSPGCVRENYNP